MKIILDFQACQSGSRYRGIGRASRSLMLAMGCFLASRGHEVVCLLNGSFDDGLHELKQDIREKLPKAKLAVFLTNIPCAAATLKNAWRQIAARMLYEHAIACQEPDFVHIPALLADGWGDDAVSSVGLLGVHIPVSLTQHDLIPLVMADHYMPAGNFRDYYMNKLQSVKFADLLLAISKYSQQEAIDWLNMNPENVVNISSAADSLFLQSGNDSLVNVTTLQQLGVRGGFFLYAPGGFDYRKNVDRLFEAYAQLPVNIRMAHQLVIVSYLEPGRRDILNQSMERHGLNLNEVVLTDYVSDETLKRLYSLCFAYVFPSLHEGFGLPALEAMACGAPVIASNCTSIPEVIGMDEALFDPYDPKSIADKMLQLHTDENFREHLVAHSKTRPSLFSWEYSGRVAADAIIEKNQQLVADGWKVTRKSALPSCDDLLKRIQLLVPTIQPSNEDLKVFQMCYESNQRLI